MKKINNKGITLIALITTIIVILILATIGVTAGMDIYEVSKLEVFIAELKIMQAEVNKLYEQYIKEETVNLEGKMTEIEDIGERITSGNSYFNKLTDQERGKYKKYTVDIIKKLGIEGITREFYVDIENRNVIAVKGIEEDGKTYYTLKEIPGAGFNVEYEEMKGNSEDSDNKPKMVVKDTSEGIVISDIEYIGNIEKWYVQYRNKGEADFKETLLDEFKITDIGTFEIKIGNGDVWSKLEEVTRVSPPK